MKLKVANIITSIIIGIFALGGGLVCMGTIGSLPYEYSDSLTFDNVEEAYEFQQLVIEEAQEVGAKVLEADITITSPPAFSYRVSVPDRSTFSYGKQGMSFVSNYAMQCLIGIMFLAVGGISIYGIWAEGGKR